MRLYAAGAPRWWRFHIVSAASRRLPPAVKNYYSLIVDNGMFSFYRQGKRPLLRHWFRQLEEYAWLLAKARSPREIVVVLPDWLYDPGFTIEAARSPEARRLCEVFRCAAVAHGNMVLSYQRAAEELASLDHVSMIAAPMKLNCSRYSTRAGRHVIQPSCQLRVASMVCPAARSHGLGCHGLGAYMSPRHVAALQSLGVTSVDTSSWTRPVTRVLGNRSARSQREREEYFRALLRRLAEAGVALEGVPDAVRAAGAGAHG